MRRVHSAQWIKRHGFTNGLWRLTERDNARDEKTVAERRWKAPLKAPKPQAACDHGLFSDEASQLDLIEMFMEPTND